MARIINGLFVVSGKFGEVVFKKRNGKVFISKLQKSKGVNMHLNSVLSRIRFALAGKIQRAFNVIPDAVLLWNAFNGLHSACSSLFKHFYDQITSEDISGVQLFPHNAFTFNVSSFAFSENKFLLQGIIPASSGLWVQRDVYVSAAAVLVVFNETEKLKNRYICIPISSDSARTVFDTELTFELALSEIQQQILKEGIRFTLLVSLITSDRNKNPVRCSQTISL